MMNRIYARGALLLPVALLIGCGGGASVQTVNQAVSNASVSRGTGVMRVSVNWPDYQPSGTATGGKHASGVSRLIPANTTDIVVTVHDGSPTGQTVTVTRAAPTQTFTLPTGTFVVDVLEYDRSSASPNVVLAEAHPSITITTANTITSPALLSISPQTDIASLVAVLVDSVTGKAIVGTPTLTTGNKIFVTATAYNANTPTPDVVPVPANSISYALVPSPTSVGSLSVDSGGNETITANQFGTANVQATLKLLKGNGLDPNNAVTFLSNTPQFKVDVRVGITPNLTTLAVLPRTVSGALPNTQQFTATVSGDNTNSVTWSITTTGGSPLSNPGTGGSISSTGLYTAPTSRGAGAYVVHATSTANTSQSATATVTIQSGTASVIVN